MLVRSEHVSPAHTRTYQSSAHSPSAPSGSPSHGSSSTPTRRRAFASTVIISDSRGNTDPALQEQERTVRPHPHNTGPSHKSAPCCASTGVCHAPSATPARPDKPVPSSRSVLNSSLALSDIGMVQRHTPSKYPLDRIPCVLLWPLLRTSSAPVLAKRFLNPTQH